MVSKQKIKQYFWYVFGIMGVVFFWVGIWDGIGNLPYLSNPFISTVVGLIMLAFSGIIFRDANPFGSPEKAAERVLHKIHAHPKKHEFTIHYKDRVKKKEVGIKGSNINTIEKGFLIMVEKGREIFIPFEHITKIKHKDKTHWKAR